MHYKHVQYLEGLIEALNVRIERMMGPPPGDGGNPAPEQVPVDPGAPLSMEQAAELIL